MTEELINAKHAIISAPPKSGKSEYPICEKLVRLEANNRTSVKVAFLSSLQRADCHDQHALYKKCDIDAFFGRGGGGVNGLRDFSKAFRKWLKEYKMIVVYIDESDYGTGEKQLMRDCFELINAERKNPIVLARYLSATNQEALYSTIFQTGDYVSLKPEIPTSYRGAKWFLDNSLVYESEPFFDEDDTGNPTSVSVQGKKLLADWLSCWKRDKKPFAVLRAKSHYSTMNRDREYYQKILDPNENFHIQYVDAKNRFFWGDYDVRPEETVASWKGAVLEEKPTLIVMNETCTRSTKVGFHPLIYFWHDNPTRDATYSTLAQALGRVFHYDYFPTNYWTNPSVTIKVYGHVPTMKLLAGEIEEADFKSVSGRELSQRISQEAQSQEVRYHLLSTTDAIDSASVKAADEAKSFIQSNPELFVWDHNSRGKDFTVETVGKRLTDSKKWKRNPLEELVNDRSGTALSGGIGRIYKNRKFVTSIIWVKPIFFKDKKVKLNHTSITLFDGSTIDVNDLRGRFLLGIRVPNAESSTPETKKSMYSAKTT